MGDLIEQLPTDKSDITHQEKYILDTLFSKNISTLNKVMKEMREGVIAGLLFIIFSLPFMDSIIKKIITSANSSPIILMGIKAILFVIVFYVVRNFSLSRN